MPERLSLSNFDAVLFDVDGTLVDSLEMIVRGLGDAIEHYFGHRPSIRQIRDLIGMPLRDQFALYSETQIEEERLSEMSIYTLGRYEVHRQHESLFDPAVAALILCHKQGLKAGLVTSKDSMELATFLEDFHGAQYLDTAVCASDVVFPKPNPESAILACQRLNVDPARAVLIGDSVYDLRCARGAGATCVAVAYGAAHRDTLLAENPDFLVDTPEELYAWAESAFLQTPCPERS